MCGIAGFVNLYERINDSDIIYEMLETIKYRGPDAEGVFTAPHCVLGHRRLAIIDLEGGAQPMHYKQGDTTYTIVYNGELYNTQELRSELVLLGYKFHTTCDTEVLLVSYIEWGEGCLSRLNGIYAFAIWNDVKRQLFLARDRMGVKPLFYAIRDNTFVFGSELKTLLAHPLIEPVLDMQGVCEIFALGPSRTQGVGVYKNVKELKPAHYINVARDDMKERRYWEFVSYTHTDSLAVTAEKVRYLLRDAVCRQLVSDVPICTFMSGGLDSSAISAIAAKQLAFEKGERLSTYSFDYVDNDKYFKKSKFQPDSDDKWVMRMKEELTSEHKILLVDTDFIVENLYEATIARDLPGMADIDSSLLGYCAQVKENHKVAISGECADEIFGGYPWFTSQKAFETHGFPWISSINNRLSILNDELLEAAEPIEYVTHRYFETIERTPRNVGENAHEARRRELFYLNIQWFMSQLLERKDRVSMRNGLEVRVPFADHNLAQYVWNIPWDMKTLNGREKGILRFALKGILPQDILERKKSPYPKTHNPGYEKAVKGILKDILADPQSPILQFINKENVANMMKQRSDYSKTFYGQLMSLPQVYGFLIQVNFWLQHYKVRLE